MFYRLVHQRQRVFDLEFSSAHSPLQVLRDTPLKAVCDEIRQQMMMAAAWRTAVTNAIAEVC
jgi:hypothetical protein